MDVSVRTRLRFFKIGRQTSQDVLRKYLRTQKWKHQALKIQLPLATVGSHPFCFLKGHQVCVLMDQSDQEPVSVGIIVNRDLHPSVFVTPEISMLGDTPFGNLQITGVVLQQDQSLLQGSLRQVLRQDVSFLIHTIDQGVELDTCSTLPL